MGAAELNLKTLAGRPGLYWLAISGYRQCPGGRVSKVCLTGFKDRQDCSWIAPRGTEGVGGAFRAYSLTAAHPHAPIGRHGRSESLRRSRRAVENGYPTADRPEDHQEYSRDENSRQDGIQ